jgi:RNA polymerase sigma factor (sigma-70 family)
VASRSDAVLVRRLRTLLYLGTTGDLSDGQLLERFATRDGEPAEQAFTVLVERHGPMVLRVCRNFLRDPHDVEDAFQATFLVLVQKAQGLWVRDSLAPWLHRVAHRVAARARASARQRREHEQRAGEARASANGAGRERHGAEAVLHDEIGRLQDRYALPVVLCYLEGLSHERAARLLGVPVGTVKSRLRRARELLRGRLARRGLTLAGGLLVGEAASGSASAAVPIALVDSTVRGAVAAAMRRAATRELISASAAKLTDEVLKTMFTTKLKMVPVVGLLVCALAAGTAVVLAQHGSAADGRRASAQPNQARSDIPGGAAAGEREPVPSYIRQSRVMIVTRLEQELRAAQGKLERTLKRVGSENDPEAARAKRTVDSLEKLIGRIDTVLVDAVDQYPTIFDFSAGPSGPAPATAASDSFDRRFDSWWDSDRGWITERELAPDKPSPKRRPTPGSQSREELEIKLGRYKAELARAQADVVRAKDRLDWATAMLKKGYVTQGAHVAAERDHEAAVEVMTQWKRAISRLEQLMNHENSSKEPGGEQSGAQEKPGGQEYKLGQPSADKQAAQQQNTPGPFGGGEGPGEQSSKQQKTGGPERNSAQRDHDKDKQGAAQQDSSGPSGASKDQAAQSQSQRQEPNQPEQQQTPQGQKQPDKRGY